MKIVRLENRNGSGPHSEALRSIGASNWFGLLDNHGPLPEMPSPLVDFPFEGRSYLEICAEVSKYIFGCPNLETFSKWYPDSFVKSLRQWGFIINEYHVPSVFVLRSESGLQCLFQRKHVTLLRRDVKVYTHG